MSLDTSRLEKYRQQGADHIARCPACALTGGDTSADHLFVNADGKFGCVLYQGESGAEHRTEIFNLAGIKSATKEKSIWTVQRSAPPSAPAPTLTHYELGIPSAHWIYRTNEGRIAGITARFNPPGQKKETRPMTWCNDQHGNTGWRWKAQSELRTIYGLPFTNRAVVIVEGEKTAEAVIAAGLPATTYQGGSGTVSKSDWSPLAGKICFIWPDNDKPGFKAQADLIAALATVAAEIHVVQIPKDMPEGWDAGDTTNEEIRRLIDEAVLLDPSDYPQPEVDESQPSPDAKQDAKPEPFKFIHASQLEGKNEAMDFVEGLLTDGGASVIYGPSNCGKSFWIVDLGVAVASGAAFRDELEVEKGAVVYIALEGSHGAKNRIAALKQVGKLKQNDPFYLIFESVSLLELGHSARLAETIARISEESGVKVRLVILDTMARAMAGGDENSGKDMTAAVKSIDAIRAATGAHVAIVHHCGKDEARGARGHSSLRAAVDTEIEVSRPEGETISTVRVTKQRDLQAGEAMPFSLEVVNIGTDRRGKPITSCIVRHEDEMLAAKPSKAGRKPTCTPEEMLRFLPAANVKEWQAAVSEETGLSRSQFYDHKRHLEAGNRVRKTSTGGLEKA